MTKATAMVPADLRFAAPVQNTNRISALEPFATRTDIRHKFCWEIGEVADTLFSEWPYGN